MKASATVTSFLRNNYRTVELKKLYPGRYRAAAKKPVEPGSVVFLEVRGKGLSDNFRLIRAALEKRNAEAQQPRYSMSLLCLREGMENPVAVTRNCMAAIEQLATAQFIFVDEVSYFLSALPIRPETTVIQTWHGCGAFKKFGYSTLGKGFGTTRKDLEKFPVHRNFSYVTVSAPEVVWAYAEAFHMEDAVERILPIGVSRTDMFFSRRYREKACQKAAWVLRQMAPTLFLMDGAQGAGSAENRDIRGREAYARLGDVYADRAGRAELAPGTEVVPGKKILLYAPTFRGSVGNAQSPNRLDLVRMRQELGKEYVLLLNHHPFIKEKDRPVIPASCKDFAFDMTGRLSIEELLTAADVCITDYSSLVFEYSLFERPLIFFAYDMEEYLDERGFYYPVSEMMPGPVCATSAEVIGAVRHAGSEFDLQRVRTFKYRFMSGCDGHATQRVLKLMDRVEKGEQA